MFRKTMITATLSIVAVMLLSTVAFGWWSDWYSPNLDGSYSPTSYRHGQWNSEVNGGTEGFGSQMKWNQTRADGVRNYSNNRQWISWCGWCYSYYTHDHDDVTGRLHISGYSTNFPSPKPDTDDDDKNGISEEFEVTSLSKSFPSTNSQYNMYTYYQRKSGGSGSLYETPAISAKPVWSSEYQTLHYDRNQTLDYYSDHSDIGSQAADSADNTDVVDSSVYFSNTVTSGDLSIVISGVQGQPYVEVGVAKAAQGSEALSSYTEWARNIPLAELSNAGAEEVLTVVTFNQPVEQKGLESTLPALSNAVVTQFRAEYVDANDPDCSTNTWTIGGFVEAGESYIDMMNDLADMTEEFHVEIGNDGQQSEASEMQEASTPIYLKPRGLVALTAWLPLSEVAHLNNNELVYLADASPSYLRMLAANTEEVKSLQADLETEQLQDGLGAAIQVDVHDLYAESQLASSSETCLATENSGLHRVFAPIVVR